MKLDQAVPKYDIWINNKRSAEAERNAVQQLWYCKTYHPDVMTTLLLPNSSTFLDYRFIISVTQPFLLPDKL